MSQGERTLVIWNPRAGKADLAESLRDDLRRRPDVRFEETASREEAIRVAAGAGEEGARLVIAAGGDGTINAVANGLARSPHGPALGVLPLGTANDFSFSLAMPDDPWEAAEVLEERRLRKMDLVRVESPETHGYFINVATGGNSDRVTASLTDEMKERWGPLSYFRGAIPVLADLASYRATVRFDDGSEESCWAWNVILANARTVAGRVAVAPRANLEDGLLEVVIVLDGTVGDLAALMTHFMAGDYTENEQVIYRRARRVEIRSEPPMRFSTDGDIVSGQPATFTVEPRALDVVVGPEYVVQPPPPGAVPEHET